MNSSNDKTCCYAVEGAGLPTNGGQDRRISVKKGLLALLMLAAWWLIYRNLSNFSKFVTYSLLDLSASSHLGSAVEFFLYDTPKVLMLLALVVFGVGVVRSFFTPERTRSILAGKRESLGNVLAALLGIVTPFCTCSAVPLFIGFVTAGVPLGVTFSFLVAAPMVNEIALVLLYGLFGWKVAGIYLGMGLLIAMISGWTIGRLHMERHLEDWVYEMQEEGDEEPEEQSLSWKERIDYGFEAVRTIVGKVWTYVVLGIALGAAIHGYVPEGFMVSIMGKGAWWSVPLAVIIGVPMYSNAAGIIPVVHALIGKGAALGTVLAFMMSVIALSLPEMVILRNVLKVRLIATFIAVVACGILIVGYLFNILV
ncbi:permease [Desulfoferrobacter suflitae]|uniref:permease n=1 Tax=Desulfoferrobacter suflitae TaxID=2865782 RepID=UPI002164BCBC|nr:permease [Desulfoferrobacter suflitae]MCK8603777.1 permease [Desulfoferrobacter suflitae]